MKSLARAYVWWPDIDRRIAEMVAECTRCLEERGNPQASPLIVWPLATSPWQGVHLDYLEINSKSFLLLVDSYSK